MVGTHCPNCSEKRIFYISYKELHCDNCKHHHSECTCKMVKLIINEYGCKSCPQCNKVWYMCEGCDKYQEDVSCGVFCRQCAYDICVCMCCGGEESSDLMTQKCKYCLHED